MLLYKLPICDDLYWMIVNMLIVNDIVTIVKEEWMPC